MIVSDNFNGEPRVFLGADGADMTFIDGQPIMDAGLENAVLISLFTKPGWYGNIFFVDVNQKIGSDYEIVTKEAITISSLNRTKQSADLALKPLLNTGIASEIIVDVTNPTSQKVDTRILVKPPGNENNELILTKNAGNWISQTLNPAHRKNGS